MRETILEGLVSCCSYLKKEHSGALSQSLKHSWSLAMKSLTSTRLPSSMGHICGAERRNGTEGEKRRQWVRGQKGREATMSNIKGTGRDGTTSILGLFEGTVLDC